MKAGNAGPFTLDGTRTYLVGRRRLAVVDPGPDDADHLNALVEAVRGAEAVTVLLTHGHADHAGGAPGLAERTGAPVVGPRGLAVELDRVIADGDEVATDEGVLRAVHTPGHTREHLCFHWLERRALFAGDLLLGEGDTTWVAEYPGCVADYLRSLERLHAFDLDVMYPAHGPPLDDPAAALDRFERHRRERIRMVEEALAQRPDATLDDLLDVVYGDALPPGMERAAKRSLEALVEHVRR